MKIIRIKQKFCEGCGLPIKECECEPCVWLGTRANCRGCPYQEDCEYISDGIRRRGQDDRITTLSK
jgi:hypothetical protein